MMIYPKPTVFLDNIYWYMYSRLFFALVLWERCNFMVFWGESVGKNVTSSLVKVDESNSEIYFQFKILRSFLHFCIIYIVIHFHLNLTFQDIKLG